MIISFQQSLYLTAELLVADASPVQKCRSLLDWNLEGCGENKERASWLVIHGISEFFSGSSLHDQGEALGAPVLLRAHYSRPRDRNVKAARAIIDAASHSSAKFFGRKFKKVLRCLVLPWRRCALDVVYDGEPVEPGIALRVSRSAKARAITDGSSGDAFD
jgi:hypothetical protein